jgi:DNA-directed RNA polymerase subunit alpha
MAENLAPRIEALQTAQDFGRFQVEPLPRGFGLTLGNALRRVLLSSLPGAAVTAVKIEGVYHEFATIPGVKEDTTELILNLKQLRLRSHSDQPVVMRLMATGPGVVTAADLIYTSDIEVVNPELHLATLDSGETRLELELTVERGTGYVPADGREPPALGVIPIDAVFTPVRRVNYSVEPARVGARTDLDRLTLEIQTDGTVTPVEALGMATDALIEAFSIFHDLTQPGRRDQKPSIAAGTVPAAARDMPIEALELSQRTYNCLKRSQITKVGQILQMSEDELLALRNFGQKSLQELREKLRQHGFLTEAEAQAGAPAPTGGAEEEDEEEPGSDLAVYDESSFDFDDEGDTDDEEE